MIPVRIKRLLNSWLVFFLLEANRHRVYAITVPGWGLRRIVKKVTKVASALGTSNFSSHHAVSAILQVLNCFVFQGLIKRRPAAVRIKFCFRFEKRSATSSAAVGTHSLFFQELAGVGAFGSCQAQNLVFKLGKLFAPLLVGLKNLVLHSKSPLQYFITVG